jgi:hypothetical protein
VQERGARRGKEARGRRGVGRGQEGDAREQLQQLRKAPRKAATSARGWLKYYVKHYLDSV